MQKSIDDDQFFQPRFDLAEFRNTAAGYLRTLIRARLLLEPDFLTREQLDRWRLTNIVGSDSVSLASHLHSAALQLARLNTEFLPRCGSGGLPPMRTDSPIGRLMEDLAFFVPPEGGGPDHNSRLLDAAEAARDHAARSLEELAEWGRLDRMRESLDQLPDRGPRTATPHEETADDVKYQFERKSEKFWELRFESMTSVSFPARAGFDHIALLIRKAPKEVAIPELSSNRQKAAGLASKVVLSESLALEDLSASWDSHNPILDRDTLQAYRQELTELESSIEEARNDNDHGKLMKLQEKRERIRRQLEENTKPDGTSKSFRTQANRERAAVKKAVDEAIKVISASSPEMARHFRDSIKWRRTGGATYLPAVPLKWRV